MKTWYMENLMRMILEGARNYLRLIHVYLQRKRQKQFRLPITLSVIPFGSYRSNTNITPHSLNVKVVSYGILRDGQLCILQQWSHKWSMHLHFFSILFWEHVFQLSSRYNWLSHFIEYFYSDIVSNGHSTVNLISSPGPVSKRIFLRSLRCTAHK